MSNVDKTLALQVSVASLQPADKEGWATKQGGKIKTWKKRWFVLKGNRLWYFSSKTDTEAKGYIELETGTVVRDESKNKRKNTFSIQARGPKGRRLFLCTAENMDQVYEWIEALKKNIQLCGGTGDGPSVSEIKKAEIIAQQPQQPPQQQQQTTGYPRPTDSAVAASVRIDSSSPRARISAAKATIPFLQEEDSKVLEFWQIWSESIPAKEELTPGQCVEFLVATSADMEKLTWRTSGPQNIFIQKMVDFFWNVGAPESEIDRLNDVGALINPIKIGSWIDMSAKGGMDGGWFFPVEIPIKLAIEAADAGEPTRKVMEWAETHSVVSCFSVGRDMGAAPPRQTELRLRLPGADFTAQFNLGAETFVTFGFPPIPEVPLTLLKENPTTETLCLSIITSCEGFVRLGLLVPSPSESLVNSLIDHAGGKRDGISKLTQTFGNKTPAFVEYQFLVKGFGYGVYKEGFDVVFHWNVGEEFNSAST